MSLHKLQDRFITLPDGRQLGYAEYGVPNGSPLSLRCASAPLFSHRSSARSSRQCASVPVASSISNSACPFAPVLANTEPSCARAVFREILKSFAACSRLLNSASFATSLDSAGLSPYRTASRLGGSCRLPGLEIKTATQLDATGISQRAKNSGETGVTRHCRTIICSGKLARSQAKKNGFDRCR